MKRKIKDKSPLSYSSFFDSFSFYFYFLFIYFLLKILCHINISTCLYIYNFLRSFFRPLPPRKRQQSRLQQQSYIPFALTPFSTFPPQKKKKCQSIQKKKTSACVYHRLPRLLLYFFPPFPPADPFPRILRARKLA